MTNDQNFLPEEAVRRRTVDFIRKKWGSLADLPKHVIPVVWATTYRSVETAMKAEAEGGPAQQRTFTSICISDPAARALPDGEAQFHIAE
jgi:hypothetical protein